MITGANSLDPFSPPKFGTVDVVVVGGGPAGSAAAHAAAKRGLSVLLIERGDVHRDKPCGDLFMPSAVEALNRLGLDRARLHAAGGIPFQGIDLFGARGRLWTVSYAKESVWMIPRRLIDQALRDGLPSGVRVIYNTTVAEILQQTQGQLAVVLAAVPAGKGTSFSCRAIALACGAQDPLSTRWGVSGTRLLAPSISAYTSARERNVPAFEFCQACRPGYRWLFPSREGENNVGICSLVKLPGSTLKSLGQELLSAYSLAQPLCWRGGIGSLWSGRGERWHHPGGIVSCGDAAGLVDPINGEGLSAALLSGERAGHALADFLLSSRDPLTLQRYSNWVKATFAARYAPSPVRMAWEHLAGMGERK